MNHTAKKSANPKKPHKTVTVGPSGAWLWDAPEPVQLVAPSPFGPFGQQRQRQGPSPARLVGLRRRYRKSPYLHWHKLMHLPRSNAAGRFMASLDEKDDRPEVLRKSLDTAATLTTAGASISASIALLNANLNRLQQLLT